MGFFRGPTIRHSRRSLHDENLATPVALQFGIISSRAIPRN
jgi:hypothetical protein